MPIGIGLRPPHYEDVLEGRVKLPFVEVISENFLGLEPGQGGRPLETLLAVRERTPVFLHGVSLNLGSTDPLDERYLDRLAALAEVVHPQHVSDHLCWTGVEGEHLHDLLPLPFTEAALAHVASRIHRVQERLGRRLLVENVSRYLAFAHAEIPEWEFLAELFRRTGCGLILDVNNIHVTAVNMGLDARTFLRAIPREAVREMHLAGYSQRGGLLIDTHDHPVSDEVLALYAEARARFGEVPTILERDDRIPPIAELMDEVARCEDAGARGQALAGDAVLTPKPSLVSELQPHAPPLAHLERWLRWSFTDPRGVAGALANEPGPRRAQEPEPRALHAIAEGPPASREERLSVYAEAYFVRLVEALSSDFPAVKRAVGAAEFHSLVAHYLMRHQSRSPSLANLGEQFPAFLAQHEPAQRWPFLPDLARLEVAVLRGLLTDRSPRTLPAPGEDADWASARLTLDQTATLLRCAWPVLTLWRERHLETTPMLPTKKRSSHLLVHRDDVWVRVRALSQTQHALLSSLHQGESLEDACAPLAEASRAPVGTWFASWIEAGIIRGLKPRQLERTG